MKAVCVRTDRTLEVRDIALPTSPAADHLVVQIEACAINHGDKTFLARPPMSLGPRRDAVWGASAVGRVVEIGAGVPATYQGRQVALYRSLRPTEETIGLWCERALIHQMGCLLLPDHVRARDYCGSLVNAMTAYAYLQDAVCHGHQAIVVTAGGSATGRALAALARRREMPVVYLVRSSSARDRLDPGHGGHVLDVSAANFDDAFAVLARDLRATAVFDGLGGEIVGRLAPLLPQKSTISFYGFLAGSAPMSVATDLFMMKDLTMNRFSNFASATVTNADALRAALLDLQGCIDDPLFHTTIGGQFGFDDIDAAMRFESTSGAKAVLLA